MSDPANKNSQRDKIQLLLVCVSVPPYIYVVSFLDLDGAGHARSAAEHVGCIPLSFSRNATEHVLKLSMSCAISSALWLWRRLAVRGCTPFAIRSLREACPTDSVAVVAGL